MVNIKRYCKKVDITDGNFIKTCIYEYLDEKWQRNDVARLFIRFSDYSFNQIKTIVRAREYGLLNEAIDNIANYIKQSLMIEKLQNGIFEICKKIVSNYDKERSKTYGKNIQSEAV